MRGGGEAARARFNLLRAPSKMAQRESKHVKKNKMEYKNKGRHLVGVGHLGGAQAVEGHEGDAAALAARQLLRQAQRHVVVLHLGGVVGKGETEGAGRVGRWAGRGRAPGQRGSVSSAGRPGLCPGMHPGGSPAQPPTAALVCPCQIRAAAHHHVEQRLVGHHLGRRVQLLAAAKQLDEGAVDLRGVEREETTGAMGVIRLARSPASVWEPPPVPARSQPHAQGRT